LRYFGENSSADCGACDVCIRKQQSPLTPKAFSAIAKKILHLLEQPKMLAEMIQSFPNEEQADMQEVLLFLEQEQTIGRNEKNEYRKNK
jgi:ATP-dependent DNA helicase RecQ